MFFIFVVDTVTDVPLHFQMCATTHPFWTCISFNNVSDVPTVPRRDINKWSLKRIVHGQYFGEEHR